MFDPTVGVLARRGWRHCLAGRRVHQAGRRRPEHRPSSTMERRSRRFDRAANDAAAVGHARPARRRLERVPVRQRRQAVGCDAERVRRRRRPHNRHPGRYASDLAAGGQRQPCPVAPVLPRLWADAGRRRRLPRGADRVPVPVPRAAQRTGWHLEQHGERHPVPGRPAGDTIRPGPTRPVSRPDCRSGPVPRCTCRPVRVSALVRRLPRA